MRTQTAIEKSRCFYRPAIVLIAAVLTLPLCVSAEEAGETNEFNQQLILEALAIYQKQADLAAIDSARDEVAAVRAQEPTETGEWKDLQIGEFETQEAFQQRQDEAHKKESDQYSAAMAEWKKAVADAETRENERRERRRAILSRDVTPKRLAYMPDKPIGGLFAFTFSPQLDLPLFDRSTMAFNDIQLPVGSREEMLQNNDAVLGQFIWPAFDLRIAIEDLEVARQFKDDVANGKVSFRLFVEPWLTDIESPIIVKPAYTEKVIDKQSVAAQILEDGIAALSGNSDAANMAGYDASHREYKKDVTHPAETRPGVRFRFELRTLAVLVVDGQGMPNKNIIITPMNSGPTNVRVFPAKGAPLDAGDQITGVDAESVSTVRQFKALMNATPIDRPVEVVFRSGSDGREHKVSLVGDDVSKLLRTILDLPAQSSE